MSPNGSPRPDNHVIVLFGASGDLAKRKLLPGLFHLHAAGLMPRDCQTARSPVWARLSGPARRRADAAHGRRARRCSAQPTPWARRCARCTPSGLAIVSAIAAAHGAELRAVTRAADGLAVEVIFPPPPPEAGRRAEGRAEALV